VNEIIFTGVVLSFLFALLFFFKPKRIYSDLLFGLMWILGVLLLLFLYIQVSGKPGTVDLFGILIAGFPQLSAILFHEAIRFLTANRKMSFRQWLFALMPVILFYFLVILVHRFPGRIVSLPGAERAIVLLFTCYNIVVVVYLMIRVMKMIARFRILMANRTSNPAAFNLSWANLYAGLSLTGAGLTMWLTLMHVFAGMNAIAANRIIASGGVITLLVAGYYGIRSGTVFTHFIRPSLQQVKYAHHRLDDASRDDFSKRLLKFMEEHKPFLDPSLTLQELAASVGIPVNDLSQVINDHLGQTFYDFVNQYRVHEFIRLLDQEKSTRYSLLGLAFGSGFNSKSSFNRIFKKISGKTPSQYHRQLIIEKKSQVAR
jgi:AraC-like DNA-binding protein